MNNRKQLRQTRGWYPNDPALFISSKATHSRKLENWIANPFSALGVLTVICSLISAVLGGTLVSVYLEPTSPGVTILYSGLFIGIFSLAAFALGLYSGILLLSRRHLARATTSIAVVLVLGVATLLAPILEKIDAPLGGLSFALPMIISSVATLCVVGLNMFSQRPRLVNQQPPTLRQRVFAGLGAAGGGLIGIGIFFYFAPVFPKHMAVITTLTIGIPLLGAAFIIRRPPKKG